MYKAKEQKAILADLQENSKSELSKIEGTFNYDMLAANSIEFGKEEVELEQAYKASFADTSWGEFLTMRAAEFGVIRKEATKAIGKVTVKGRGNLPEGSIFATAGGLRFVTLADTEVIDSLEVKVEAVEAGSEGNVGPGAVNQIPMNIPGITEVNNDLAMYDGYDEETDEQLLERYLLKVRTPATSGNVYHYQQWALSIEGVGQVKVLPLWAGPGTVKVVIVDSNNATANQDLINRVAAYIESVRPIGATVTVTSPEPLLINVTAAIEGFAEMDKIKANINEYLKGFGFSLKTVSLNRIGKILLDSGLEDYNNLLINGFPENIVLTDDQLPVCGEVVLTDG